MQSSFWSNTIWFLLLGASSVIEIIFILKKARNPKHEIALFLSVSGIAFSFEAAIFCFLKAYYYYPMIFLGSPIEDGLAGNLFSQFSVVTTAILIAVLNLKYYWYFIFSMVYGIIEELFLRLGIYSHNWYRTWMTMLGLILLFWVVKKIYNNRTIYNGNSKRYFFMLFGLYTLHMPFIYWPFILSKIVVLNVKILPDAMNSYALISLINLFLLSITCMVLYFSKLKWWWKSIIILALYSTIYLADKFNVIYIKEGWFLIFATIDIFGMFLCIYILDKLFNSGDGEINY